MLDLFKNPPDRIRDFFTLVFCLSFLGVLVSLFTTTHFTVANHSFSILILLLILILISSWVMFVLRWKGDMPLYITNRRTGKVTESKHGKTFISILIVVFISLLSYIGIILPISLDLVFEASRLEIEEVKEVELYLESNKRYFLSLEPIPSDGGESLRMMFKKGGWEKSFGATDTRNTIHNEGINFPENGTYQVEFDMYDYNKNIRAIRIFSK